MGRSKNFDPDAVLRRAVELFMERGYEGTSVADLEEYLGISRSSLYATFGSKRELYQAAVRFHLCSTQPRLLDLLSRPGPALPAVRALIEELVHEARRAPGRQGCLLVNAAVALPREVPEVVSQVRTGWRDLEAYLASALARAQVQGELARDRDPAELAGFLMVLLQGVYVIARLAPDDARRLSAAVRQVLTMLD